MRRIANGCCMNVGLLLLCYCVWESLIQSPTHFIMAAALCGVRRSANGRRGWYGLLLSPGELIEPTALLNTLFAYVYTYYALPNNLVSEIAQQDIK
jgi:hypothetical protein